MTAFTPGPWKQSGREVLPPDSCGIIDCCGICECFHGSQPNVVEANARLIAAAPELLAALKALANEAAKSVEISAWPELQVLIEDADVAVAKATQP